MNRYDAYFECTSKGFVNGTIKHLPNETGEWVKFKDIEIQPTANVQPFPEWETVMDAIPHQGMIISGDTVKLVYDAMKQLVEGK